MKTHLLKIAFTLLLMSLFMGCATTGANKSAKPEVDDSEKPVKFVFPPYEGNGEKPRVAVFDFTNDTPFENAVLGKGVANTLVTALVKSKHFRVVERSMLRKILEEQGLELSGAVDPQKTVEVGKLLGVDYMIMGSISEFGVKSSHTSVGYGGNVDASIGVTKGTARVVLDVRVIDPATGEIVSSESGVGTHYSTNVGLAYKEISLLTGTVGFDQTLIGKATRKAVFDIVSKFIENGF